MSTSGLSGIVRADEVIGKGRNETRSGPDASAHAEVQAIRDAWHREDPCDLTGATLYTSMEPFPMCSWAIVEARIGRLVLGARHDAIRKYGDDWLATPGGYGGYVVETLLDLTNRKLDVVTGVRTHECGQIRAEWKR